MIFQRPGRKEEELMINNLQTQHLIKNFIKVRIQVVTLMSMKFQVQEVENK
jgi:hypothetical protein